MKDNSDNLSAPCPNSYVKISKFALNHEILSDDGLYSPEYSKLLHAYIREKDYTDCRVQVEAQLNEMAVPFTVERIADRNWNEVWESNFEPIEVEGKCSIRAPFHTPRPDLPYDIVIMPKMAFGTGHHATTQLMVEEILDLSLQGLNGLDMGCGTAVFGHDAWSCAHGCHRYR